MRLKFLFHFPPCCNFHFSVILSVTIYVYIKTYFVLLQFTLYASQIDSAFYFIFFYKLKVCGNPVFSKSIAMIFPTPFAQFASLCHICYFSQYFYFFIIMFVVVIFDVTVLIVLELHELCPNNSVSFINVVCVLTASPACHFLVSSGFPIP